MYIGTARNVDTISVGACFRCYDKKIRDDHSVTSGKYDMDSWAVHVCQSAEFQIMTSIEYYCLSFTKIQILHADFVTLNSHVIKKIDKFINL